MPAKRLSMRKLEEILRLRFGIGLSERKIAKCCQVSRNTVRNYAQRAEAVGITWPIPRLEWILSKNS